MPIDINEFSRFNLKKYENKRCLLLEFNNDIAWELGDFARNNVYQFRDRNGQGYNAVIDVSLTNGHTLFRAPVKRGTGLENDSWIETKQNTVKKTSKSSLYDFCKTERKDFSIWAADVCVPGKTEYTSKGGSIPIRVKGLDYMVGMLTLSGTNHVKDHVLAYESLEAFPK